MRNWNLVCMGLVGVLLAVAGCRQNERLAASNLSPTAAVEPPVAAPTFTTVTLSAEQLMSLDWSGRGPGRSTIVDKRIAGAGVEFDIRFPGGAGVPSMDLVSTGAAGNGALAGLDVGKYQSLALKFTLISVGGSNDPNLPVGIAAGAVIGPAGDGRLSACEPVVLGFSPEQVTKVAVTPMHTEGIRMIGIHAHVVNPLAWDPHGGVVTLRVDPAADAQILPSPAPVADSKSGDEPARSVRTRSRAQPAKPTTSNSADKPRTKPPVSPTLGTTHIGAW